MGIKNYVKEFQDYFFIKRTILERLDKTSLSPSNLELSYNNLEELIEDFKVNLNFIDTESIEVQQEVEDIIDSLNNKINKINNYAFALKTINSSERDSKNMIDMHPYIFNKNIINWEAQTQSYILTPTSSYKVLTPYSSSSTNNRCLSKFLLNSDFSTKYVFISKSINTNLISTSFFDSNMTLINTLSMTDTVGKTTCLLTIPTNTRYLYINNIGIENDITITPLAYTHKKEAVLPLEEVSYKKGNILTFKSITDIPEGCFIQLKMTFTFKDINGNITNTVDKWYSIDNDELIILKVKDVTKEKIYKVWRESVFVEVTDKDILKDEDYVLCKELDNLLVVNNTESSFLIKENKASTFVLNSTLYMYSLYNTTQTPRISNLIGIIKDVN